jgi:hypothetical protein
MSLIRKTDNSLSARHRTEIHLVPESGADATGFPHEEPAGAEPEANHSMENARDLSSISGCKPATVAPPKSARD